MTDTVRVYCPVCQAEVERPADLWTAAARTPRRLYRAVRGLTAADLAYRPRPDAWSLREVILHLADTELVHGYRLRRALAEDSAELPAYDPAAWAVGAAYDRRDLRAAISAFRALRLANLDLLRSAGEAAFGRAGRHPRFGPLTVGQLFGHLVDHDRDHLRQLEWTRAVVEGKVDPGLS